jgi:hypothetical protein
MADGATLPAAESPPPAPWECSCGGTDDFDSIECVDCRTRHHVACAFTLLRGKDNTAKWAVLRDESFSCIRCSPALYSWRFRCSCLRASAPGSVVTEDLLLPAVVIDWDDELDQNQCEQCWCWAHTNCVFISTTTVTAPTDVSGASATNNADQNFTNATTVTKTLCPFCAGISTDDDCAGTFRFEGTPESANQASPPPLIVLDNDKRFKRVTSRTASNLSEQRGAEAETIASGVNASSVQLVKNLERINGLYWRRGMRDDKIYDEVVLRGVYERPKFDLEILPGDVWLE